MEEVLFQDVSESNNPTVGQTQASSHSDLQQRCVVGGDKGHHGGLLQPCLKNVPNEVWQQIFSFTQSSRVGYHYAGKMSGLQGRSILPDKMDYRNLATICTVSRSWRQVAIGHHSLWTSLPPLVVRDLEDSKLGWIQLFIPRAGSLPLACNITIHPRAWDQDQGAVQGAVKVLTDQCHRWGTATIDFPYEAITPLLSCLEGKLPMLSSLVLCTCPAPTVSDMNNCTLNLFSEAPKLRTASITILGSIPNFEIHFPWSQLQYVSLSVPGGSSYKDLIEAQPTDLKELQYCASHTSDPPIPSTPILFPKLEHFSLSQSEQDGAFFIDHLDQLTLPALKYFSLARPEDMHPDVFYVKLLSLIQRSGCSLETLDLRPTEVPTTNPAYFDILALSPKLTEINIGHSAIGELLSKLVLDPTSSKPMLPFLQRLQLCDFMSDGGPPARMDVNALMRVVRSRTLDLPHSTGIEIGCVLKPLNSLVINSYDMRLLHDDLTLWESQELGDRFQKYGSPDPLTLPSMTPERVEVAAEMFGGYITTLLMDGDASQEDFFEITAGMVRLLDELEALDVENRNTSLLLRKNVLFSLDYASRKDVAVPDLPLSAGEVIRAIRSRSKQILDRWRPFILRDLAACPYIWSYGDWSGQSCPATMERWNVCPGEEGTSWHRLISEGLCEAED
ncbi:hypothetical protein DFP72DRAFT_1170556 [Ephemerocybe angulata]|uniref:F-box domain-containing protein n=1 Tax=Ephemerocybe angulata TaxID=980116 RepID=A0A8H6M4A3_9AGAR|nr:hypothetical protein DFP72DRAFT_1170556 [Tulosesus angulatus]